MQARVPISAADVARLLESMGVDRVIAVDLHCGQIQGFFGPRVPVDNLEGGIVGIDHFGGKDLHNPVIVSPDAGGVYRAKKFKEGLAYKYGWEDIGIAMIIKQRARAGSVDQMDLVGDVKDCDCIIVDDMIDTAGTLCKAADVLVAKGARRVFAFASHGLLSGPGNERIAGSKLEECVILNTIPSTPQSWWSSVWHHCLLKRSSTFTQSEVFRPCLSKLAGGLLAMVKLVGRFIIRGLYIGRRVPTRC
jgi:ribose-phosphate pyrophosphokinase